MLANLKQAYAVKLGDGADAKIGISLVTQLPELDQDLAARCALLPDILGSKDAAHSALDNIGVPRLALANATPVALKDITGLSHLPLNIPMVTPNLPTAPDVTTGGADSVFDALNKSSDIPTMG